MDLRIENFRSNRIMNRIGGYDSNLESNQGVVSRLRVQCRLPQELCRPTAYYRELPHCILRRNVIVQYYSECVTVYELIHKDKIINIKQISITTVQWLKFFLLNSECGLWFVVRRQVS